MLVKDDSLAASGGISDLQLQRQVDRILNSELFGGSEVLRNLLSYLLKCSIQGREHPVKVREIATEVFGRSADFDSQTDSVVRVHTGRLRSKLAEYYMGEGQSDELIVSIPKGAYVLAFGARHTTGRAVSAAPEPPGSARASRIALESEQPSFTPIVQPAPTRFITGRLILALAICVLAVLAIAVTRNRLSQENDSPALRRFWSGFVAKGQSPLLVFSNLRLNDLGDPRKSTVDTYTTVGEVMGVAEVSHILSRFGTLGRAKPGSLVTWDEAKDNNLIFIGGPLAETPLREVALFKEFQFRPRDAAAFDKPGSIVNVHPRQNEQPLFFGPNARPFEFDYALIAFRPAFSPAYNSLAIAGITEYGTWAAADFVTREDRVSELLAKLTTNTGRTLPYFEALLRVRIQGGVPVQSSVILIRQASDDGR